MDEEIEESSGGCMLCRIDALECEEGARRAVYYLIGRNAPEGRHEPCEAHLRTQVLGLAMFAVLTGHGEHADSIRKTLDSPMLRLVTSDPEEMSDPREGG